MANYQYFIVTKPNGDKEYVGAYSYMEALLAVRGTGATVTQPQQHGTEPALRPSGHTW